VVIRAAQGRGYARDAAHSLVAVLQEAGWTWSPISTPVTWPPSGSPVLPGYHQPPTSTTARCAGSACRLQCHNCAARPPDTPDIADERMSHCCYQILPNDTRRVRDTGTSSQLGRYCKYDSKSGVCTSLAVNERGKY
jgi:hypothetical protein